jgi:VanZ family protein
MRPLRWRAFWLVAGLLGTAYGVYLALRPPGGSPPWFPSGDKLQHTLSYVAMGLWFAALFERRHLLRVALGLFTFGVLVEMMQAAMPYGRAAEWVDLLANSAGIAVAIGLTVALRESWMVVVERLFGGTGP